MMTASVSLAQVSDDALMVLVASADRDAMGEVARRFTPMLTAFFVARTRDCHRADDLTQNTLVKVMRNAQHYVDNRARYGNNGNVNAWMMVVARNSLVDDVRRMAADGFNKAARVTAKGEELVAVCASQPDRETVSVASQDGVGRIMEYVNLLPRDQAQAFVAVHVHGQTAGEVAAAFGLPKGTVQSRVRLAAEKLREMLTRDEAILVAA